MNFINIENRREVLWDDYLLDSDKTTATLKLHHPQKKELAITFDQPWEAMGIAYPQFIKVGDVYRLYYVCNINRAASEGDEGGQARAVCMMESKDLKTWVRYNAGKFEFNGSKDNNMLYQTKKYGTFNEVLDNFFVFCDENPDCPPDEKFKAIALCYDQTGIDTSAPLENWIDDTRCLYCYTSPDGIDFKLGWLVADNKKAVFGGYDSMNTVWYNTEKGKYECFIRSWIPTLGRTVRYMESDDMKNWSDAQLLDFGEGSHEFELYTNGAARYPRAPHMLYAMPMRYVERHGWSPNFEQLCGPEGSRLRKERCAVMERQGTAITDCMFMSSRDGVHWKRFEEDFLGSGPEHAGNWRYGEASQVTHGYTETPMEYAEQGNELSLYVPEGTWGKEPMKMYRHSIRLDGFASYRADSDIKTVVTKPIMFGGDEMSINFSTSAAGWIFVEILDANGKPYENFISCELFGDTTDRTVYFGDSCDLSKLKYKKIRLKFTMCEADLYSFVFRNKEV